MRDVRAARWKVGEDELIVVSVPLPGATPELGLTEAERAIAEAVQRGLSNAAIGRLRGTSARTVANQLAAIYRKLGVSSRGELASVLAERSSR